MRQVWITRHGPPEVLDVREAVAPEPGDNEVLIKVAAAGVNFADIMARLGLYPDAPKPPCVVGYEVAGEVTALGPSATGFAALQQGALPFSASRPRWAAVDGSERRAHFSACHGSASIRSR
jgi:NADPH:quinone reductase-like Zn-dependent oxidoreductase